MLVHKSKGVISVGQNATRDDGIELTLTNKIIDFYISHIVLQAGSGMNTHVPTVQCNNQGKESSPT